MPSLGNGFLAKVIFVTTSRQPIVHARKCQYAGHLHYPPNQQLHAQKGVAAPCAQYRNEEYNERGICEIYVFVWNSIIMPADYAPLPQCADKQNGWQAHFDDVGRNEYDAEGNDKKTNYNQWGIDAESTFLAWFCFAASSTSSIIEKTIPNLQKLCTPHQQTKASVMSGCLDIL